MSFRARSQSSSRYTHSLLPDLLLRYSGCLSLNPSSEIIMPANLRKTKRKQQTRLTFTPISSSSPDRRHQRVATVSYDRSSSPAKDQDVYFNSSTSSANSCSLYPSPPRSKATLPTPLSSSPIFQGNPQGMAL